MENDSSRVQVDDGRSTKRGRLMGKLFGKDAKDRKAQDAASKASLDAFLHSSADLVQVTHPPPPPLPPQAGIPKLTKLDTTIMRYPQALAVNHQAQLNRPLAPGYHDSAKQSSRPVRPNKKGLIVRFTDAYPDIIGEGGDESEVPVIEVSRRKAARPIQPVPPRRPVPAPATLPSGPTEPYTTPDADAFSPKLLGRTQTGFSSMYEPDADEECVPGRPSQSRDGKGAGFLEAMQRRDENRKSYIELHQAQMREAEGQAFAQAARSSRTSEEHEWEKDEHGISLAQDGSPSSAAGRPATPDDQPQPPLADYSPAGSIRSLDPNTPDPLARSNTVCGHEHVSRPYEAAPGHARSNSTRLQSSAAAAAAADFALASFVQRTTHLFELFRLHAEASRPIMTCALKECSRASLWWFLNGRMGLEVAVRQRQHSTKPQMQADLERQQAYANLAKGYWLSEEVIPEIAKTRGPPPDAEVVEIARSLLNGLKKLALSMEKNGFLPPEEPVLPQTIDNSIWLQYPPLSQDMVALLTGNWGYGLTAMQHPMSTLDLLDAFPVADTSENFSYGRVSAAVSLMEQGRQAQVLHFPCLLSVVRPQTELGLVFVLASQDGSVQLAVQENRNAGPVWDDVRWRSEGYALDIRLPRGFLLTVQVTPQDYRLLWNMYEFGAQVRKTMHPRGDERMIFRNTLRSFQYIDPNPQSRAFPKESVPLCNVALFEKVHQESSPTGLRTWHRGFRVAVMTSPRTRTLSGVHHTFVPTVPVQFGFFRTENHVPALSLKYESGKQRGRMVMVFHDENERIHFHSLLTGTKISHDEKVFANVPLRRYTLSQSMREPTGVAPFDRMPWESVRVINEESGCQGGEPPTVLADKLRVVLGYRNGTITDRVNVAPGELRLRLEVTNAKLLRVARQPQQDVTMSVAEDQVPKDVPRNMADALQLLKTNQTIRSLEFASMTDLHAFQAALTGFEVVFDGVACTFAIARRRMVVPIHKKWEAGYTRLQIVRQEDKQLQLLAFFEDFHHGHCMNFALKKTDVYESFGRGGKSGVKLVDAKFPLPRVPEKVEGGDCDDAAFISLDLPDLPGEHDDISIVFEREEGELRTAERGCGWAFGADVEVCRPR